MYKNYEVQSNVTKPKFSLIILFQVYFKNHKWGFIIQNGNIYSLYLQNLISNSRPCFPNPVFSIFQTSET